MQAGPADPQSSSDQLPEAISGKTRRIGVPRSLIIGTSFAFFSAMFMPPPTGLIASEGALIPASFTAGFAACTPQLPPTKTSFGHSGQHLIQTGTIRDVNRS